MPRFHNIVTKSTKSCQRLTNSATIPFCPRISFTVPLAYLGVGLRGDKEKRNSLYGQITNIIPNRIYGHAA